MCASNTNTCKKQKSMYEYYYGGKTEIRTENAQCLNNSCVLINKTVIYLQILATIRREN